MAVLLERNALMRAPGGISQILRRISRRRGLLISLFAAVAVVDVLWGRAEPVDFLSPDGWRLSVWLWALLVVAVVVRVWGAGNLSKNREVTRTGVYRMVRHPLYLGNYLVFLVFFLSFGDLALGIPLAVLTLALHYPLMLQEEARLAGEYPDAFPACRRTPRLLPDLRAFPAALASDCFSFARVRRNRGARSLLALLLPFGMEVLARLKDLV
jgi:protein-S-isoprenylcysteine O-methyltransferase Ste14